MKNISESLRNLIKAAEVPGLEVHKSLGFLQGTIAYTHKQITSEIESVERIIKNAHQDAKDMETE